MKIRKIVTIVEETNGDGQKIANQVARKAAAIAVVKNPYANQYSENLEQLILMGDELGKILAKKAVTALGITPEQVQAYGKGAIVGEQGEIEHTAAILHFRTPELGFGKSFREETDGGRAILFANSKMGAMGTTLDIPLGHKEACFVIDNWDTMEIRVADAPKADEIVVVAVVTDSGRVLSRVPGLHQEEIAIFDGQR